MDDSDLLILTLNQLGCLPEPVDPNQKINSISEIQDNDFRIIIHRIINKIIQIKGMDVSFRKSFNRYVKKISRNTKNSRIY